MEIIYGLNHGLIHGSILYNLNATKFANQTRHIWSKQKDRQYVLIFLRKFKFYSWMKKVKTKKGVNTKY